jgi:DNA-binding NarL/FixJ family response regulator
MANEGDIIRENRKAMEEATTTFLRSLPPSQFRYDMAEAIAGSLLAKGSAVGNDLESVLSMVLDGAEEDATLIRQWAANKGRKGGTRRTDYNEVKRLVGLGLTKTEVARKMGISRETVRQALKAG